MTERFLKAVEKLYSTLFCLLRLGLSDKYGLESLDPAVDWEKLYSLSALQGVAPIVLDGIQSVYGAGFDLEIPRTVLRKWAAMTTHTEKKYALQRKASADLAQFYSSKGIRTVLLKGAAFAENYPLPEHRYSSDFDCFLFDDYEKGNEEIEKMGIGVDRSHYKHSGFKYEGVEVENHRFCLAVRADKRSKSLELLLESLLKEGPLGYIEGTQLLMPPPLFNALFMLEHSFGHFLREGLSLRQITDWALLCDNYADRLDWERFERICIEYGLVRFRDCISRIADYILRAKGELSELDRKVLDSMLVQDKPFDYHKSAIHSRVELVRNALNSAWKYREFAGRTMTGTLLQSFWGLLFDKNPKLNETK